MALTLEGRFLNREPRWAADHPGNTPIGISESRALIFGMGKIEKERVFTFGLSAVSDGRFLIQQTVSSREPSGSRRRKLLEGRPAKSLFICYALFLLGFLFIFSARSSAQRPKPTDYEVKAAYLYNFGKFVSWPAPTGEADNTHFVVCILGANPLRDALDKTVAGELLNGRAVMSRQIADPQEALTACQILFISASERGRLHEVLARLENIPVLTVSDMPDFAREGGVIQFVMRGDRVRFEVNLGASHKTGLTLSSELLKVAVAVLGQGSGKD
jgi:hypothetical protein